MLNLVWIYAAIVRYSWEVKLNGGIASTHDHIGRAINNSSSGITIYNYADPAITYNDIYGNGYAIRNYTANDINGNTGKSKNIVSQMRNIRGRVFYNSGESWVDAYVQKKQNVKVNRKNVTEILIFKE